MFHAHTDRMIDEWRQRRGAGRRLPARTELSPVLFGALLPQMFVLADEGARGWRFRLAGGFLVDLHGRELRGEAFADLWRSDDRAAVRSALAKARRAAEPQVLGVRGETCEGDGLALEVTLAPVTGPTEAPDRVLGLYQPVSMMARLLGRPLEALTLTGGGALRRPGGPRLVVDNTVAVPLV